MKLATLKNGSRDGQLVIVSRDLSKAISAEGIAPTLQTALDDWDTLAPALTDRATQLERGAAENAMAFDPKQAMAPLPRSYQWLDGSVYKSHGELMQKGFDTENRIAISTDTPSMYQGASDVLLGACDDIETVDETWGIDFEAEMVVVISDVRMQSTPEAAEKAIRLIMLANDVSLRNLIMAELAKHFGFVQSKPATSFSPVAVTPDELGTAWRGGLVHHRMLIHFNGDPFGRPHAGTGALFGFGQLVAHAAKTRHLCAGTIVGSGTVSNPDPSVGSACIAERRAGERIATGAAKTPFMRFGDRVRIEMLDDSGRSIFGAIDQRVVRLAQ